jgi:hypothetical protein
MQGHWHSRSQISDGGGPKMTTPVDAIPPYYRYAASTPPRDVFDIAYAYQLDAQQTMALKYVIRAGRKAGVSKADDLAKAVACLRRALSYEGVMP